MAMPQTMPDMTEPYDGPTMYDLPSEDPEEPGVPDLFHDMQADLLTETFLPPTHPRDRMMTAADLNLHYDRDHPLRYKRPDWYAVLGVPFLYKGQDLRMSYVVPDEKVIPFIVVELLSKSTRSDDLGLKERKPGEPPTKWEVYEQVLGIPHYVVFSRHAERFRAFRLDRGRYVERIVPEGRLWFPEIGLGLGLWEGVYQTLDHRWLRWYDSRGRWIPSVEERAEQERMRAEQADQRAEQERMRAEQADQRAEQADQRAEQADQRAGQEKMRADRMLAQLRSLGIEPDMSEE